MGRKIMGGIVFVLVLGLITGLWATEDKPELVKRNTQAVVAGNNTFALDFYGQLSSQSGNLFFSPYSISAALAMTYAGARGETEKQMAKVLRFDSDQSKFHPLFAQVINNLKTNKPKGYELNIANALWGQKGYGFLKPFLTLIQENYVAGLREVDFGTTTEEARQTINAWVEKETKDKIKELIKPNILNNLTRLVLTNAIYFKGNWDVQFDKEKTKDESFTLLAGEKVNVPLMGYKKMPHLKYTKGTGCQILEMPYVDKELSMVVFLPDKVDGINDLEKLLTADNLAQWLPKMYEQEVAVSLPKFKLTCDFILNDQFIALGMPDAFDNSKADFSGMTGKKDLYISRVIHKAFVDVNEEGTEAAAATAVVMGLKGMPMPPPVFRADHPFIFMIRDMRSGSILFMGRVMDPRS
jgi:serpin B